MSKNWVEFGYLNAYRISPMGEVQTRWKRGRYPVLLDAWRDRKTSFQRCDYTGAGYLVTSLLVGPGCYKKYYIHRLVAELFIPNPHGLEQVNHKDYDRMNNHVSNLEWVSPVENMAHASAKIKELGIRRYSGRITRDMALEMVDMINRGERNKDIAAKFGVDQSNVSKLRHRRPGMYEELHSLIRCPV